MVRLCSKELRGALNLTSYLIRIFSGCIHIVYSLVTFVIPHCYLLCGQRIFLLCFITKQRGILMIDPTEKKG
jgi:hypothetical protein